MYKIIIIIFVIIFLYILLGMNKMESFDPNFQSDIYAAIRPPYSIAKQFKAKQFAPFRVLKDNFLMYPIRG